MIPHASPRWDQSQNLSGCSAALGTSAGVQVRVWVQLGPPGERVSVRSVHVFICVFVQHQQSRAVVPLFNMTRNQQMGWLGSRSSYWADLVSEPSCRWEPHCTCVQVCTHSPGSMCIASYKPPSCSDRERKQDGAGGAACFCLFLCKCCVSVGINQCGQVYMHPKTIKYVYEFSFCMIRKWLSPQGNIHAWQDTPKGLLHLQPLSFQE